MIEKSKIMLFRRILLYLYEFCNTIKVGLLFQSEVKQYQLAIKDYGNVLLIGPMKR